MTYGRSDASHLSCSQGEISAAASAEIAISAISAAISLHPRRYTPFTAETVEEVFEHVLSHVQADAVRWPEEADHLSVEACEYIRLMLHPLPEKRLGAESFKELRAASFFYDIDWDMLSQAISADCLGEASRRASVDLGAISPRSARARHRSSQNSRASTTLRTSATTLRHSPPRPPTPPTRIAGRRRGPHARARTLPVPRLTTATSRRDAHRARARRSAARRSGRRGRPRTRAPSARATRRRATTQTSSTSRITT